MSIFKSAESGTWFVDITTRSGARIRRSAGTKDRRQAQEYHDKLKSEAWRVEQLGERRQYTFDEACVMYLKSCLDLRDYTSKQAHIKYWLTHFKSKALSSLTTDAITRATPSMKRVQSGPALPMSNGTKNRYLATLGSLLHLCVKRGWISAMPHIEKFREAQVRESFLTQDEARALLVALPEGWMRDVTEFALMTGMRAGEILSLEWDQVDLSRGLVSILASKAKSGSSRAVPLNNTARSVIERRAGLHKQFVFARCDQQTSMIDREMFQRALKVAGIKRNVRFHDCRHSWASWHAQAGTPLLQLQRAGGWKTLAMLNKYAHLNAEHLMAMSAAVDLNDKIGSRSISDVKKPLALVA